VSKMLRRPSRADLSSSTMSNVAGALDSIDERDIRINRLAERRRLGAQTTRKLRRARLGALTLSVTNRTKALELNGRQNGDRSRDRWLVDPACHTSNLTG